MNAATLKHCWWAYLAVLVYRLGGVAGATRRVVFAWHCDFTCRQIESSVRNLYPGLRPGEHQVGDVIEWMRRRQLIECFAEDENGKAYRRCERRFAPVAAEINPQLTLCLE